MRIIQMKSHFAMNAIKENVNDGLPISRSLGWWYVVLGLLPAMWLQGAFHVRSFDSDPVLAVMLAVDAMIVLRAEIGIILGQSSRMWPAYCMMLFLVSPVTTWIVGIGW